MVFYSSFIIISVFRSPGLQILDFGIFPAVQNLYGFLIKFYYDFGLSEPWPSDPGFLDFFDRPEPIWFSIQVSVFRILTKAKNERNEYSDFKT